jgi:hypothetical protein
MEAGESTRASIDRTYATVGLVPYTQVLQFGELLWDCPFEMKAGLLIRSILEAADWIKARVVEIVGSPTRLCKNADA